MRCDTRPSAKNVSKAWVVQQQHPNEGFPNALHTSIGLVMCLMWVSCGMWHVSVLSVEGACVMSVLSDEGACGKCVMLRGVC